MVYLFKLITRSEPTLDILDEYMCMHTKEVPAGVTSFNALLLEPEWPVSVPCQDFYP